MKRVNVLFYKYLHLYVNKMSFETLPLYKPPILHMYVYG